MTNRTYSCGLEASLAIVGGRWTGLIMAHLAKGTLRFGELRKSVESISEKMLIQELKRLEGDKIVNRKNYNEIPPRVEYSLTPLGAELFETMFPLSEWGKKNMLLISKMASQQK